jgi:hypothetical protein
MMCEGGESRAGWNRAAARGAWNSFENISDRASDCGNIPEIRETDFWDGAACVTRTRDPRITKVQKHCSDKGLN